ncbi:AAA family ATPase [Sulfitobacter sp. 1A13191]|uniref:AAA family ATPase n=1 Tax=Sulfitobacter sp. 1A13191 TaxID=3368589 RepID=UPI00374625C2
MEVAVKSIVSQMQTGVIFTGECQVGRIYRIRVTEALFPAVGETYEVEGPRSNFKNDYGRTYCQIDASTIERTATSGHLLTAYLTTLTGIGEARARRLIAAFGEQINEVLQQPDRLDDIASALQPGRLTLGRKLAFHLQAEFTAKVADDQIQIKQFRFYKRLESLGVQDRSAARKLWRLLGGSTADDALIANPYLAAALIPWSTADALGQSILRSQSAKDIGNHPERLRGAVDSATRRLLLGGDTAATEGRWMSLAPKGISGPKMIAEGLKCGSLIRQGGLIRPLGAKYLEDDVSRNLVSLSKLPHRHSNFEIEETVSATERQIALQLTAEQRRVVGEILGRPLAFLQGGAGVGKTTVMSAVTVSWETLGGNVLMAASSGKA